MDRDGGVFIAATGGANWQGDGGVNPIHPYSGQDDILVMKLDRNGVYLWDTFYGTDLEDGCINPTPF